MVSDQPGGSLPTLSYAAPRGFSPAQLAANGQINSTQIVSTHLSYLATDSSNATSALSLAFHIAVCPPGFGVSISTGQLQCQPCQPGTFSALFSRGNCQQCPPGTSQALTMATSCDKCQPGFYANFVGQRSCDACTELYSHAGASSCTVCRAGLLQRNSTTDMAAASPTCAACPTGAKCTRPGTTVADLVLERGYYRMTSRTTDVQKCSMSGRSNASGHAPATSETTSTAAASVGGTASVQAPPHAFVRTPCVGGPSPGVDGTGYCAANLSGPLCEICLVPDHYFDTGECLPCPAFSVLAGALAAGLLAILLLVLAVRYLWESRIDRWPWLRPLTTCHLSLVTCHLSLTH